MHEGIDYTVNPGTNIKADHNKKVILRINGQPVNPQDYLNN
ncbi:hypothetical protein [Sporohalobacter salinus]|nr:hypothetical protein [Sporohalobacter salinus]MBM7623252.1 murein DD-endopeptidase MepM/ murein hydrolase activator NlpD [Sporohalobacter salinus]